MKCGAGGVWGRYGNPFSPHLKAKNIPTAPPNSWFMFVLFFFFTWALKFIINACGAVEAGQWVMQPG